MVFKDNSYLELWWPFVRLIKTILCNYESRHHEEHYCEIILNLV